MQNLRYVARESRESPSSRQQPFLCLLSLTMPGRPLANHTRMPYNTRNTYCWSPLFHVSRLKIPYNINSPVRMADTKNIQYKAYHVPDHRLIMLYTAYQNKMHGNPYCTYSRVTTQSLLCLIPRLIMLYYYNYFHVCPRDTYKIHVIVPVLHIQDWY